MSIYLYIFATPCFTFRLLSLCHIFSLWPIDRGRRSTGYCLYGDNAYVNESYMAVPFQAMSYGPKDSYNFYHLQVRINIECAFSILTNRWCLLKTPLSAKFLIMHLYLVFVSCIIFVLTTEMQDLQKGILMIC